MRLEEYISAHSKFPFEEGDLSKNFIHSKQHMICGKVAGNFLAMMIQIIQPNNVLEIGTMIGYSTICMAQHLKKSAKIYTIENRFEDYEKALANFKKYKVDKKIEAFCGDAIEIIPKLQKKWDMVFIDADKINYVNYYKLVFPNLKHNGIIFADNALFHNKVIDQNNNEKNVVGIKQFNDFVVQDDKTNNVLLNIRDGIQFIVKK